jgi:flavin reductase (DIM6/NTAB) family NADH-FMN oxidoreductase RutF
MATEWGASAATVRAVLAHRAAGVAVVTTRLGEERRGLTVSAWCSAALDPPLVLVCVEQVTTSHDLIEQSRVFALTILAREQEFLADRFAGRAIPVGPTFDGVPHTEAVTGAPILGGGIGWLDCRVADIYPAGTHSIIVGAVVAAADSTEAAHLEPLISLRRRYVGIAD